MLNIFSISTFSTVCWHYYNNYMSGSIASLSVCLNDMQGFPTK